MQVHVKIPGTVLLVPGLAGGADPLRRERERVLDDLRRALSPSRGGVESVAVRAGCVSDTEVSRPVPDLGPAGVDERWSEWSFTGNGTGVGEGRRSRANLAATVALLALGGAGWTRPVDVAPVDDVDRCTLDDAVVVVTRAGEPC